MIATYCMLVAAIVTTVTGQYGQSAPVAQPQPMYHAPQQPMQQYQQPQQNYGGCQDTWQKPSDCQYWAQTGECQKNPYFMNWKCKASCGACGGSSGGQSSGGSINWPKYTKTSDDCYIKVENYAWQCLKPVSREANVSLEKCLAACLANSGCKSVVVSANGGTCDLYGDKIDFASRAPAQNSQLAGARFRLSRSKRSTYNPSNAGPQCGSPELCKNSGYHYYENTGSCTGTPEATTTIGSACPDGQVQFTFKLADGGEQVGCLKLPGTCGGPGLLAPDSVLVGFAKVVYTVNTPEECYEKCATEASFDCAGSGSGLFFYEGSDNCILNEETLTTQPDQMAPNPGSDYFELNC